MIRRVVWGTLVIGTAVIVACSSDDTSSGASSSSGSSTSSTSSASSTSGAPSSSSGSTSSSGDASSDAPSDAPSDSPSGPFTLTSTAFAEGGTIPVANAKCPGGAGNESPPLAWTNAPAGTQSFAIIMRDLSLGGANNYHWVIYDIPASTTSLPAAVPAQAAPPSPAGAKQTYWSFSNTYSYQGPCPPNEHTYEFTVYALPTATAAVPANTTNPATAAAVITAAATSSAKLAGKYKQ